LFAAVFANGWRIRFGHRTFPWQSEAAKAAAVHCVIVGFDKRRGSQADLYEYDQRGLLLGKSSAPQVNAYLVPGPNVLVEQRRKPLSAVVYPFGFGSRPNDGGAFVLDEESLQTAGGDPIARKYIRPFVGAREIVQGQSRWVLWLRDAPQGEVERSDFLSERVSQCREHRLASKRPATREWADRPHLFDFDSQPAQPYVAVPGVSSENRPYYLAARFDSHVIASNAAFTANDPDGLLFSLVSSSMFVAWQRTVGGRLKSDLRFSNTVVWSNFPVPPLGREGRATIVAAGKRVEHVRSQHAGRTLADLYLPGRIPAELQDAHQALDTAVDTAFGLATTSNSLAKRQKVLFERYAELLSATRT
jgi:hypothetical protein